MGENDPLDVLKGMANPLAAFKEMADPLAAYKEMAHPLAAYKEMASPLDALKGVIPTLPVLPSFEVPRYTLPRLPDSTVNPAKWMHERIVRSIASFEEGLDKDDEVGGRLVTFGAEVTFHIDNVGYWGPDIITFQGVDHHGRKVELLQHISQLSVLLVAVRKEKEVPRRIGFALVSALKEDQG